MKKFVFAVAVVLASFVGGLCLVELGLSLFWKEPDSAHLLDRMRTPLMSNRVAGSLGCDWGEMFVPHPYFGYALSELAGCPLDKASSRYGFRSGEEIPQLRDPDHFSVLITGASVAYQFADWSSKGPTGLERLLNENYISPNGKPFRTLGATLEGWNAPQRVAVLDLYGNGVDAAISIDGFMEAFYMNRPHAMSMPKTIYLSSQRSIYDSAFIGEQWLMKRLFAVASRFPVVRRAALVRLLAQSLLDEMSRALGDDGAEGKNHLRLYRYFPTPAGLDGQQWKLREYEKSIRLLQATAGALGIRYAHFLQPIPGMKKALAAEERREKDQVRAADYQKLVELFAKLARQGMPVFDLTDLFEHETGTIYIDQMHCRCEPGDCLGYTLMSRRIARELARAWHLKPRRGARGIR